MARFSSAARLDWPPAMTGAPAGPGRFSPTPLRRALRWTGLVLVATWTITAIAVVLFSLGPRAFGRQTLVVRSGSMEPAIPTGSVVVVRPVRPETLRIGDVITFERSDGDVAVVTHRIVDVLRSGPSPIFQTQGDANAAPDPMPVQYRNQGWLVTAVVPYAGYFLNALSHPLARAALIGIPALLLVASFLRDLWGPGR